MTNNPKKVEAFVYDGFDLSVVEQVPLVAPCNKHNRFYMETKRDKMDHALGEEV